jgi:hypothetical protein
VRCTSPGAVEALEDLAELAHRNADAAVGDIDVDPVAPDLRHAHVHLHRRVRVLHGVVEQVAEHHAELLGVAPHRGVGRALELHRRIGQRVAALHLADALEQDVRESHAAAAHLARRLLGARGLTPGPRCGRCARVVCISAVAAARWAQPWRVNVST